MAEAGASGSGVASASGAGVAAGAAGGAGTGASAGASGGVAGVAAGASVAAICAAPGMPAARTVAQWTRDDPLFAAEIAAARSRAAWRRASVIDEGKAAAMLERVRNGEPFRAVLGQPGMPTWVQFRRWRTFHADFAETVFPLLKRRGEKLAARAQAGRRAERGRAPPGAAARRR